MDALKDRKPFGNGAKVVPVSHQSRARWCCLGFEVDDTTVVVSNTKTVQGIAIVVEGRVKDGSASKGFPVLDTYLVVP